MWPLVTQNLLGQHLAAEPVAPWPMAGVTAMIEEPSAGSEGTSASVIFRGGAT